VGVISDRDNSNLYRHHHNNAYSYLLLKNVKSKAYGTQLEEIIADSPGDF
jgi:hypothetical protein